MEHQPSREVLREKLQGELSKFTTGEIMAALVECGDRFNEIDRLLNEYCDELERRGTSAEEQLDIMRADNG
jgi:hypothetical protein